MRIRQIPLVLVISGIVACNGTDGGGGRTYSFEVVQRYGSEELGADSLNYPVDVRRAGAAVLGQIVGVVQAPDSTVFVLDRSFFKIAAFRPNGELKRILLGGKGQGPGEFQLPRHLAMMHTGELVALDYTLRRLLFFDRDAGFLSSTALDVSGPLRLFPIGEEIWITRAVTPGSTSPRAVAVDRSGRRTREASPLPEAERPFGGVVNLAVSSDGRLLLPHTRPGLWDVLGEEERGPRGRELVPGLAPPITRQEGNEIYLGSPEAETLGLVPLHNGLLILWYRTLKMTADGKPEPGSIRTLLEVFEENGRHVGSVMLPPEVDSFGQLFASAIAGHVFVTVTDPYPAVAELKLREVGRD